MRLFWLLFGFDALVALGAGAMFAAALRFGSLSQLDVMSWLMLLAFLGAVLLGSLRLRRGGKRRPAVALLLVPALPLLLGAAGLFVLLATTTNWR